MKCNHCNAEVKDGAKFCPFCGAEISVEGKKRCPKCGAECLDEEQFCSQCGCSLETGEQAESFLKEEEEADKGRSSKLKYLIACIALIVALLGGWYYFSHHNSTGTVEMNTNVQNVSED